MFEFIDFDTNENNVIEDYIKEFEKETGVEFPSILVDFYMNHNRCKIKEFSFFVHDLEFSVEFIIPLKYGNICVENVMRFNEGNEYVPNTFIPLAEDVDGDDFYWDSNSKKVYYLAMGNVENPIPICDSVEQFFEILNEFCK